MWRIVCIPRRQEDSRTAESIPTSFCAMIRPLTEHADHIDSGLRPQRITHNKYLVSEQNLVESMELFWLLYPNAGNSRVAVEQLVKKYFIEY